MIPVVFIGFGLLLISGVERADSKLSKDNIESLIKDKTDLILPKEFIIVENKIEHTEGAFDSGYSIELILETKIQKKNL